MNKGFDDSKTPRSSSTFGNKLIQLKCIAICVFLWMLSSAKKVTMETLVSWLVDVDKSPEPMGLAFSKKEFDKLGKAHVVQVHISFV